MKKKKELPKDLLYIAKTYGVGMAMFCIGVGGIPKVMLKKERKNKKRDI